jgi:hypothetical protein
MTKTSALFGILTLVGLGWASSGCKNSCNDLEDLCNSCPSNWQSSCDSDLAACRALPSAPGVLSEGDCCDNAINQWDNHC